MTQHVSVAAFTGMAGRAGGSRGSDAMGGRPSGDPGVAEQRPVGIAAYPASPPPLVDTPFVPPPPPLPFNVPQNIARVDSVFITPLTPPPPPKPDDPISIKRPASELGFYDTTLPPVGIFEPPAVVAAEPASPPVGIFEPELPANTAPTIPDAVPPIGIFTEPELPANTAPTIPDAVPSVFTPPLSTVPINYVTAPAPSTNAPVSVTVSTPQKTAETSVLRDYLIPIAVSLTAFFLTRG